MVNRFVDRFFVPLTFILVLVLGCLLTFPLYAQNSQLDVVIRVRNAHPNLPGNRPVTNQALREIAADPAVNGGIYVKTTGNNCLGYSCDLICYKDGRFYDVFVAWDTKALAAWNLSPSKADPSRCQLLGDGSVPPPPTDCKTCETALVAARNSNTQLTNENNQLKKEKAALLVENKRIYDQLQEWDARLNKCLVDFNVLLNKYNNVTCSTPSYLGWHSPCTVVKPLL